MTCIKQNLYVSINRYDINIIEYQVIKERHMCYLIKLTDNLLLDCRGKGIQWCRRLKDDDLLI